MECHDHHCPATAPRRPVRRATRDTSHPIIGGVAAGLARHLGVPVLWVRAAFLVAAVLGGIGILFYAGLWLVLPAELALRPRGARASRAPPDRAAARAGSAGSPTPAPPSPWSRSASAWC